MREKINELTDESTCLPLALGLDFLPPLSCCTRIGVLYFTKDDAIPTSSRLLTFAAEFFFPSESYACAARGGYNRLTTETQFD